MTTAHDVDVTLSADLLRRLRAEARELGVPLSWLVASLIVDTVDSIDVDVPVAA
jgi:hypothetical protein